MWTAFYKKYKKQDDISQQQVDQLQQILSNLTKTSPQPNKIVYQTPVQTPMRKKQPKLRIIPVFGIKLSLHKTKLVLKKIILSKILDIKVGAATNPQTPKIQPKIRNQNCYQFEKQYAMATSQQSEQFKQLRPFSCMMKAVVDLINILWPSLKKTTKPQCLMEIKRQASQLQKWFNSRIQAYNKTKSFNSCFVLETVEKVTPLVKLVQKTMMS